MAEGYVLLFDVAGYAMHDKETWSLEKDGDASELADRTLNWFRSLDKKRSANLEKIIAKWQPLLFLLMALVAIVGPRFTLTMSKRRAINLPKKAPTGTGQIAPATAPAKGNGAGVVAENGNGPGNAGGDGPANATLSPLSKQDFFHLFGESH